MSIYERRKPVCVCVATTTKKENFHICMHIYKFIQMGS